MMILICLKFYFSYNYRSQVLIDGQPNGVDAKTFMVKTGHDIPPDRQAYVLLKGIKVVDTEDF